MDSADFEPQRSVPSQGDKTDPSRETLFRAALRVALEQGFGHVTLALVAERAGVSKGGLLYHFPTKRKLIEAMLSHYSRDATRSNTEQGIDPLAVSILIAGIRKPASPNRSRGISCGR